MLTYERVRELFTYNPETGTLRRKIDRHYNAKKGDIVGCNGGQGYLEVRIDGRLYLVHRIIWLYTYGYLPEKQVDHINRCRFDNKIVNLREASQQCQSRNCGNRLDNTSGIKGIHWYKQTHKYQASIRVANKSFHLGYYRDFDEAVCARLAVEQCLDWSKCDIESPAFKYVRKYIQR